MTTIQCEVLEFERIEWTYAGAKESAIREWFGWSTTRYFQVLNTVLNLPAADLYDPTNVRRLRRIRETRRAARSVR